MGGGRGETPEDVLGMVCAAVEETDADRMEALRLILDYATFKLGETRRMSPGEPVGELTGDAGATPAARVQGARALFRAGQPRLAMSELALAFHALARLHPPGVQPWDPEPLLAWVERMRGRATPHEIACAHFVLSVWNLRDTEAALGTLNIMDALSGWDSQHRAAFVEWAREPWWP